MRRRPYQAYSQFVLAVIVGTVGAPNTPRLDTYQSRRRQPIFELTSGLSWTNSGVHIQALYFSDRTPTVEGCQGFFSSSHGIIHSPTPTDLQDKKRRPLLQIQESLHELRSEVHLPDFFYWLFAVGYRPSTGIPQCIAAVQSTTFLLWERGFCFLPAL